MSRNNINNNDQHRSGSHYTAVHRAQSQRGGKATSIFNFTNPNCARAREKISDFKNKSDVGTFRGELLPLLRGRY